MTTPRPPRARAFLGMLAVAIAWALVLFAIGAGAFLVLSWMLGSQFGQLLDVLGIAPG